ncbi:MAG TPA: ABC transporter substrate-binding protein [bacterium]|nr:ABC transporter substrate-binding protein [bacterium]
MRKQAIVLMAVVAVAAMLLGSLTVGTSAQSRKTLTLIMPTTPPNLIHIPPWVALETGLFAKYGIDVRILTVESGAVAMRSLVGGRGEVHLAAPGVPPFLALAAQGGEVKAVATYSMRHPVAMVVQPEIQSCQDLRGKKIGTPGGVGAYTEVMVRAFLQSCGLTPRDVQYVNIATGARVPALLTAQIDGMPLHVDQVYEIQKQKPSMRILGYLADILPKGWYAAYVTLFDVIRADPALIGNAVMALVEANRFIYQNPGKTLDIAVKYTKVDRDVLQKAYNDYTRRGLWPVNEGLHPDLVEEGLTTEVNVGTIPANNKLKYEELVQINFLKAAMTKLGRWTGDPRWY